MLRFVIQIEQGGKRETIAIWEGSITQAKIGIKQMEEEFNTFVRNLEIKNG